MNEARRTSRSRRKPAGVDPGVSDGHNGPAAGHDGLEALVGLVEAPKWWPFQYTTPENAKQLRRDRANRTISRFLQLPPAPF